MSENIGAAPEAAIATNEESEIESSAPVQGDEIDKALAGPSKEEKKEEVKKSNKRTLKLKVDGEEIDEEIDLDDEEALRKHLQMSKVANKRMSESRELQKQINELMEFVQKNPRGFLKELGMNEEELAEQILSEAIENSKKSPDQIEREKLQAELEKLRKDKDSAEEARKQAEFEKLQEQASKQLESEMLEALDTAKLPQSPYIVKRVADYLSLALENNIDLSVKDVLPLVQQELRGDMKQMIAAMGDEVLEEYVGKDRLGSYRKKMIAAAKQAAANTSNAPSSAKETGQKAPSKAPVEAKKITVRDWLKS